MITVNKKYEIGDIVFVSKYSYKKNIIKKGQNHLFVIIDADKIEAVPAEYFGMIVSSRREKSKEVSKFKYNEPLNKNINNGLRSDSIVKCDEMYYLSPKNIRFKIGSVNTEDYLRFINSYQKAIDKLEKISN